MKAIHIIAVGKLKSPHFVTAAKHYTERLKHGYKLEETIIRDADSHLSIDERKNIEGEKILKALTPKDLVICMDEHGKQPDSVEFSKFLAPIWEHAHLRPCFIIGGAFGISQLVLTKAKHLLALSKMTFPHEMARVVLFEQLYRADSILRGAPYHHI